MKVWRFILVFPYYRRVEVRWRYEDRGVHRV
jgi:hypothetical protein